MADDTAAAAHLPPDPSSDPLLPAPTKRCRLDPDGRDLRRVAEIVMVLAAMGQMRGGRDPSPAERSLVAEARRGLVAACDPLRPNDLFTSEAARVIAGDLGFSHQVGGRPGRKVPISQKVALTKKKMEEGKEFAMQPTGASPYQVAHPQGGVAAAKAELRAMTQSQGMQRAPAERPSAIPQASAGFQTVLPVGHSASNTTTWKQMPFGDMQQSVAQMRPPVGSIGKDSAAPAAGPSVKPIRPEVPHFRSNVRPGGPPHPFQFQAMPSGSLLPVKSTSTPTVVSTSTATMPTNSSQVIKPVVQTPTVVESSCGVSKTQTFPPSTEDQSSRTPLQTIKGNVSRAEHFSQNANAFPSLIVNSIEIAKSIRKFLQPKAIDLSGWILPSLDYMSHPLSCQICKISITDTESLLVCDACEKGVHLRCLKSFNQKALTNQEWHCPKCLLACNGKTLPPKYGKVSRSIGVPRPPPNTAGAHASPDKRPEIPQVSSEKRPQISDPKVSHQKVATGVKTRSSQRLDTPDMTISSSEQKSDTPLVNSNDIRDRYISNGTQVDAGNLLDRESCSNQTTEIGREGRHSGEGRKNLGPSPCSIKGSNSEFALDLRTDSHHNPEVPPTTGGEICDQPENAALDQPESAAICQTGNDTGLPLSSMSMGNSNGGSANCISKEPGRTSGLDDNCEKKTATEMREEICESPKLQSNLNYQDEALINKVVDASVPKKLSEQNVTNDMRGKTCNDAVDGAKDCKLSPFPGLQNVDWVGEAIKRVDNKSYYQSCCINDVIYNLQDHVLLPDGCKLSPSKLQALWEDIKDGSKWAMVNRCYFPADIPEAIIRPSTTENNEVYESNDSYTVEASRIHGPSVVVNLMKFNEESEMRTYLAGWKNASCTIFFCRWFYDKTNELFLPLSG